MNIDFDTMLYRPIANGKEFENLIPKSTCKMQKSGIGETDFSMKEIKAMSEEYSWQMQKVAQLLKTSSLTDNVENVKDFIYNHFQYKADKEDQMMRSPACSWYDRYNGIDCKSYSILASCILSEMQIKHYVRRIKQPSFAPNDYTHVYVIVPIDQKNANLQKGYYTVDGTLEDDNEPAFISKDDIFMSLTHYRLNGYNGMGNPNPNGSNFQPPASSQQPPDASNNQGILDFLKKLNLKINLKDIRADHLLQSVFGCGKTAYSDAARAIIHENITKYYASLFYEINEYVLKNNMVLFGETVNEFFGMTKVLAQTSSKKISEGKWNACTTKNIKANGQLFELYSNHVTQFFNAWLVDNFDKTATSTSLKYDNSQTEKAPYNFNFTKTNSVITVNEPFYSYTPKAKAIPAFEITLPVIQAFEQKKPVDILAAVALLSTVIANFSPNNNNGTTFPDNGNITFDEAGNPIQPEQAGFGVAGWAILAIGATWLITGGFKNMGVNKPATRTIAARKTPARKATVKK